jgi:hypothetical protein
MSNLVKLIYNLNGLESSVSFDIANKISSLKSLINLTQHINLDDYVVTYAGKEIKWTDETPLKSIIGKTKVPVFMIDKKKEVIEKEKKEKEEKKKAEESKHKDNTKQDPKVKENTKTEENKQKDNKPDPNKPKDPKAAGKPDETKTKESQDKTAQSKPNTTEKKKDDAKSPTPPANKNEKDSPKPGTAKVESHDSKDKNQNHHDKKDDTLVNLKCKVILESFPSKAEMFEKFESFIKSKDAQKDYHINTLSESLEITFKNPVFSIKLRI